MLASSFFLQSCFVFLCFFRVFKMFIVGLATVVRLCFMSDIVLLIHWLYCIDLFSCIAASLFNKLTLHYLLYFTIPALNPAEAGTRLSDPGGMQGWVDLSPAHAALPSLVLYTHRPAGRRRRRTKRLTVDCGHCNKVHALAEPSDVLKSSISGLSCRRNVQRWLHWYPLPNSAVPRHQSAERP